MKLTESQLQDIISEEIQAMIEEGELDEGVLDRLRARAAGLGAKAKGKAKAAAIGLGGKVVGLGSKELGSALKQQAAAKGEEARRAGEKAKKEKMITLAYKEFTNDLDKLGIKMEGDVLNAIRGMEKALRISKEDSKFKSE
tara:strand:+ start:106 stop:528 length:423 start_codon:yes stop_codon:yes gene_type:complete